MNKKTKIILGSFGAAALAVIGAGGAIAATQTNSTANTFLERVAQVAGVDPETLKSSFKQVSTEKIEEKLQNGEITEEQAARMKEGLENGNYGFGFGGGRHGGKDGFLRQDMDALAEFLGITSDELMQKQHESEMTLIEIAIEQGKTEEQLKTFLSNKFDENLKQAVTDGKLTQEKANEIIEKKEEMITNMMNRFGFKG